MEFDLENPLPISPESKAETLSSLFDIESDHLPSCTYPQNLKATTGCCGIRGQIITLILNFSQKFDPFLSYLAINYLDRFLSTQPILEEKPWILRLVAVTCLSLAVKMRKMAESSISDIQHDGGIIFDFQTIERMEFLILDSLKWRMRSITPFCFINFFISLFKFKDPPSTKALKARATEIILKAQSDMTLLNFRPSIISASALLSASHELFPLQFPSYQNAILNCSCVNKESFTICYNVVQEIAMEGYESVFDMVSSSTTPVSVLDLHCLSTLSSDNEQSQSKKRTDQEARAIATLRLEKELKRRKIGGFRSLNTYNQFSCPKLSSAS